METHLSYASATEVAEAIRSRTISAVAVLETQLDRITHHNPQLNALVTVDVEGARQRAIEADAALARGEIWGPLHGVPITIKDFFEVAGMRSTGSCPTFAKHISQQDAISVARLRSAGAVILGKTNLPEQAMDFQTNSPLFGRTNNPWDITHTPGGSTGGGAAAVAAGLSFLELGSDLGGSIRIPAHFCGIYALAPTYNLVPQTGWIPEPPHTGTLANFIRVGPLTRSLADLRLGLEVLAGPDLHQPDVPPVTLKAPPSRPLQTLRIAWTDDCGLPLCTDTRAALHTVVQQLIDQGCHVERARPENFDFELAQQLHKRFLFNAVGTHLPFTERWLGRYLGKIAAFDLNMHKLLEAEAARMRLIVELEHFLAQWDAWLLPVAARPAYPHLEPLRRRGAYAEYDPLSVDDHPVPYSLVNAGLTIPFNVTGQPVVVLPIGQSSEGLPIGAQLIGQRWHDMELLNVAEELDAVIGAWRSPPGY